MDTNEAQVKLTSLYNEMQGLIDEITQLKTNPSSKLRLDHQYAELDKILLEKRKQLGISIEDLELQTDISFSTIQRILKDPHNAKLSNVLSICNELGVKLWIEK